MQIYDEFLNDKIEVAEDTGFEVKQEEVSPALKPHQKDAVIWACKGGRRALFESFGLGKTIQQLEFCRLAVKHEGGKALIVVPLGVRQEFQRDAEQLLGMEKPPYVRNMEEIRACKSNIMLTNYERVRDGDIDPTYFTATSLDEASVLRSFGSDTYQTFLQKFKGVRYKLVSTATPSPNRYKELIHYAGYLEIMDTGQALTRFFKRDSQKAGNLQLHEAQEKEFWLWLSSWALFITKPSDLGYDDTGYDLPPLDVRYHKIPVNHAEAGADKNGQIKLLRDATLSLADEAREKRDSVQARVQKAKEIVDASADDHFILWHDRNDERDEIKRTFPGISYIDGAMDYDLREQRVIDFSEGKTQLFATKKELSGSGCNFQRHCHRAIFVGIDYKFNDFIQAIHRIYRFLQNKQVIIDIIYTESESEILDTLLKKWKQHNYMTEQMTQIVRQYGLSNHKRIQNLKREKGVKRVEMAGNYYKAIQNDCVIETQNMKENSIDLMVTSIPFSNHYEYTPNYNDFGHNKDTQAFFRQMDYLSPELLRILKPGRVFCCHVKDRVLFGSQTGTGMSTIEPFHAMCISHYMQHGFQYFGMITVITDVVRENNQTYRLGYTEQCKDGTKMGVGCPEYILLFRKLPTDTSRAYADVPVVKDKKDYSCARWQLDAHGFWRSSGNRALTREDLQNYSHDVIQKMFKQFSRQSVYDYNGHVQLCETLEEEGKLPTSYMMLPPQSWNDEVWDDVNRMRTLNTTQSARRQTMHICPLQLDIVERLIERYSMEGETVFDPFAGLFTVPMVAVQKGRFGIGTELNGGYFMDGVKYLKAAEEDRDMPTLFDLLKVAGD